MINFRFAKLILICCLLITLCQPSAAEDYICGDANSDGALNVGDAVYMINYVFKNGPAPPDGCCADCEDGQTEPCYTGHPSTQGVGECTDGVRTCVLGVWGECIGQVLPELEDCDGLDNDCDGATDEDLQPVPCANQEGVCAGSLSSCQGGAWQPCGPSEYGPNYEAVETTCDGLDNDCDGAIDEGLGPIPCELQDGVCAGSFKSCQGGAWQTCGPAQYGPNYETNEISCDGLDNDCDGAIDEGDPGGGGACNTGLQGVCENGTLHCVAGALSCEQNQTASPEICDGLDNDCDGQIDEGNPEGGAPCNTGLPGICSSGTLQCIGGALVCVQDQAPSPEVCDGLDNDCDGAVDDGNPGGGLACNTGIPGECAAGTTQCTAGAIVCLQNQTPTVEICDGLDNDCDGQIDEGNPEGGGSCSTGLPGVCSSGTLQCVGGTLVCVQDQAPTPEICDGLDNDCNGAVDDGNPGGGLACNTGIPGECAAGTTQCTAGAIVCLQNQTPTPETCDNLDNDCDGQIDEGDPGGGGACSTGLPGVCAAGTQHCIGGALVCVQDIAPSPEVCDDGLDNDCDGLTDTADSDCP